MYGDLANKLVLEAKRTQKLNSRQNQQYALPMYHEELVQGILREIGQLKLNSELLKEQQQQEGFTDDKVSKCQYFVILLCLERNKRCLLAYQKMRSNILDYLAWQNSDADATNGVISPAQATSDLSHQEQDYLKEYTDLLTELKSGEFADIDISGSLTPPSEVFIDVRVLKDVGEIQTEYGAFNLIKNSQFFVRQSDVERLIRQGYLQKI